MQFIRGLHNLSHFTETCVATIGVFDGLHRGHHAVIKQVITKAQQLHLRSAVILFEPQPFEFFHPDRPIPRLTRLRDKLILLKEWQVDIVLCLRFNAKLAHYSAETFIQKILVEGLHVQHLIIGDDFHFGAQRQGNFDLLKTAGTRFNFTVEDTTTLLDQGVRISSTRVREAIISGEFSKAAHLLGRPYSLYGKVQHGDKRGRLLGFPTINIGSLKPMVVQGVYLVRVYGIKSQPLFGVANVGRRPTINGLRRLLEVYLLDYQDTCYGHAVRVEFMAKIRDEQKFASLDILKQKINEDVIIAKQMLSASQASEHHPPVKATS